MIISKLKRSFPPTARRTHSTVSNSMAYSLSTIISPTPVTTEQSTVSDFFRQADFTLNQNQQMDKLIADASISDCEFSANNSDSNVNIKCSAGFYKAVANPAFSALSPGFSQRVAGALVTCSSIEPSYDYRGLEFNRIFFFSIRDTDGVTAPITIHLHHTTRLVQVQGGAILHDGQVAAIWFVKNLILELFLELSQAKGHDITAFNQAVLQNNFKSSGTFSDLTCPHCNRPLKKPAKPVKCFACRTTFHTSCHKQHTCSGTPVRPRLVTRMKRKASDISTFDDSIFEIVDQPQCSSTQQ